MTISDTQKRQTLMQLGALGLASAGLHAKAQSWPARPVSLVVPATAGGPLDFVARVVADSLSRRLKQPVVIDNKAGASGMVGAAFAAKAPADGYTLFVTAATEVAINQWFFSNMRYNPETELIPVAMLTKLPLALIAGAPSGIKNMKELIARAKAKPDTIKFANGGSGGLQHLAAEVMTRQAGLKVIHVPYRGIAPAVNDLLGGTVDAAFVGLPAALPHIRSGKAIALGLSTAQPSSSVPEIPTVGSAPELRGYDITQWFGIMAPTGTPANVVSQLNAEINACLNETVVRARLFASGAETVIGTPSQFGQFIASERAKFGKVVKDANIKVES